jgi:hypothetical protein
MPGLIRVDLNERVEFGLPPADSPEERLDNGS